MRTLRCCNVVTNRICDKKLSSGEAYDPARLFISMGRLLWKLLHIFFKALASSLQPRNHQTRGWHTVNWQWEREVRWMVGLEDCTAIYRSFFIKQTIIFGSSGSRLRYRHAIILLWYQWHGYHDEELHKNVFKVTFTTNNTFLYIPQAPCKALSYKNMYVRKAHSTDEKKTRVMIN